MAAWLKRYAEQSAGLAIAALFWAIIVVIAIIATAQSSKPWDTLIATMAMATQAFFAFMVWRLGQAQYEFTQKVTDRQHKIDAYPLRVEAVNRLENLIDRNLTPPKIIEMEDAEGFRVSYGEIYRLFSGKASDLSYELSRTVDKAVGQIERRAEPILYEGMPQRFQPFQLTAEGHRLLKRAVSISGQLRMMLEVETRIM